MVKVNDRPRPETDAPVHYIDFILKARSVGLTLAEMKRVVMLAQDGTNPCPEIVHCRAERKTAPRSCVDDAGWGTLRI